MLIQVTQSSIFNYVIQVTVLLNDNMLIQPYYCSKKLNFLNILVESITSLCSPYLAPKLDCLNAIPICTADFIAYNSIYILH